MAEMLVRKFEKETVIRCLYFRLSVVCGRLITKPYGVMYKFDVFYDPAKFLLRFKLKNIDDWANRYKVNCRIDARMSVKEKFRPQHHSRRLRGKGFMPVSPFKCKRKEHPT